MKQLLLIAYLVLHFTIIAQNKADLARHSRQVEMSQKKETVLISLDTIFDKGIPVGLVQMKGEKMLSIRNLENAELVFIREAERKDRSFYTFNGNLPKIVQFEVKGAYWSEVETYCKMLLDKGVILNGEIIPAQLGAFVRENAVLSQALQNHFKEVEESKKMGKVTVSLDTIFDKGERFGIVKKISDDGISVRNLEDKELIVIKKEYYKGLEDLIFSTTGQYYSVFIFPSQNKRAETNDYFWGLRAYADAIIKEGLIKGNELDIEAVDRFVLVHGNKESQKRQNSEFSSILGGNKSNNNNNSNDSPSSTNASSNGYVTRNKNASISFNYDKIEQDFKVIGLVRRNSGMSMSGEKINIIAISFPNGAGVAEAQATLSTENEWNVITAKDGKQHTLTVKAKEMEVEELARFLILNNYL